MNRGFMGGGMGNGGDRWGNLPELNPRQIQSIREDLQASGKNPDTFDPTQNLLWKWPDKDRMAVYLLGGTTSMGLFFLAVMKFQRDGTADVRVTEAEQRLRRAQQENGVEIDATAQPATVVTTITRTYAD